MFRSRRAARIALAISAHADPARSPFPRPLFDRPAPQVEEGLYRALLDVLPRLLADVDEYRSLWGPEDAALTNTEHLFDAGRITIEVRIPAQTDHRFRRKPITDSGRN